MPSLMFEDASCVEEPLSDSGFTVGWTLQTLYDSSEEFREALGSSKVKKVRIGGRRINVTPIHKVFLLGRNLSPFLQRVVSLNLLVVVPYGAGAGYDGAHRDYGRRGMGKYCGSMHTLFS